MASADYASPNLTQQHEADPEIEEPSSPMRTGLVGAALPGIVFFLGHFFIIYITIRYKALRSSMGIYILNLASVDILHLTQLPFMVSSMYQESWTGGEIGCKTYTALTWMRVAVHSLSLVAMTINMCFPLEWLVGAKQAVWGTLIACGLVWIISGLGSIPQVIYYDLISVPSFHDNSEILFTCAERWPDRMAAFVYSNVIVYYIPVALILLFIFVYGLIRIVCPANRRRYKHDNTWPVIAVNAAYIIFSSPQFIFNTVGEFEPSIWEYQHISLIFKVMVYVSAANSIIKPILYPIVSRTYRKAYVMAITCKSDDEVTRAINNITNQNVIEMDKHPSQM